MTRTEEDCRPGRPGGRAVALYLPRLGRPPGLRRLVGAAVGHGRGRRWQDGRLLPALAPPVALGPAELRGPGRPGGRWSLGHNAGCRGELNLLLHNAKVEGPFLLVGHSLGGLNMQVFASRYPDHVIGAVLLDHPPLQSG
jgi:pimeloyl-ACP methyl ester carboxylesterase